MQPNTEKSPYGDDWFVWITTDEELAHINEILGSDLDRSNKLRKTNMQIERVDCPGCGKQSGMDDFVENAVRMGIHSPEFIKETFLGERDIEKTQSANLECSRCHTSFGVTATWRAYPPWPSG